MKKLFQREIKEEGVNNYNEEIKEELKNNWTKKGV